MQLNNKKLSMDEFLKEREDFMQTWPTGQGVAFEEGVRYQLALPESKRFSCALEKAERENKTLCQPRAGVALVNEHIQLLQFLENSCDLLPTTIDAYTRLNHYEKAAEGIERSNAAGTSLLNGFPAVNYGVDICRKVTSSVKSPVQVRHGTPDARLLTEISVAGGFTS